jgi:hypothetical protein
MVMLLKFAPKKILKYTLLKKAKNLMILKKEKFY